MASDKRQRKYKSVPIESVLSNTVVTEADPTKRLSDELKRAYEKVRLSDPEVTARMEVFYKYKRIIEAEMDCVVEQYGSTKTRTMVNNSDLDMTLVFKNNGQYDLSREFSNEVLGRLRNIIRAPEHSNKCVIHLRKARIPILKFKDGMSHFKVDISVNKIDAIEASKFILQEIKKRPGIEKMVILLKHFLKERSLGDAATGGLCAYAQFLMILHFLQMHPLIQNSNIQLEDNLGPIFMDLFQFYGIDFPYRRSVISVRDSKYKPNYINNIYIEDPMVEGNNVTGACNSIEFVRSVFAHMYKIMAVALSETVNPKKSLVSLWISSEDYKTKIDRKRMKKPNKTYI